MKSFPVKPGGIFNWTKDEGLMRQKIDSDYLLSFVKLSFGCCANNHYPLLWTGPGLRRDGTSSNRHSSQIEVVPSRRKSGSYNKLDRAQLRATKKGCCSYRALPHCFIILFLMKYLSLKTSTIYIPECRCLMSIELFMRCCRTILPCTSIKRTW